MYANISVVGERGQITIPKIIRELTGIKEKDKVIVKMEKDKIVVEKMNSKREREKLMEEGYKKMAKENLEICKEMEAASFEAMNKYEY